MPLRRRHHGPRGDGGHKVTEPNRYPAPGAYRAAGRKAAAIAITIVAGVALAILALAVLLS